MKWSPVFYLAGYAGTGKTTLAIELASIAKGAVAFAAFTGKAARVMRSKGCDGARTIHSLIYYYHDDPKTGLKVPVLKDPSHLDWCSLIIIDECSMVNEQMGKDLLTFGKPILVLGDPAQLPPVSGGGYFTNGTPDYMLTEVHRQAAESPILRLATAVREGRYKPNPFRTDGLEIVRRADLRRESVTGADTVIVGRNETRKKFNGRLRSLRGFQSVMPEIGETLMCLRNDSATGISNGEIFTVADVWKAKGSARKLRFNLVDPDDAERSAFEAIVLKDFFLDDVAAAKLPMRDLYGTNQFTYGYAITGHKSQGSQWNNVCVFDESRVFRDDASRWLYTAVTRASQHLTLVI